MDAPLVIFFCIPGKFFRKPMFKTPGDLASLEEPLSAIHCG